MCILYLLVAGLIVPCFIHIFLIKNLLLIEFECVLECVRAS